MEMTPHLTAHRLQNVKDLQQYMTTMLARMQQNFIINAEY